MSYLGIRGFESILRGGIPQRAEVLLLTPEGAQRHLLGAHWAVEGLKRGERVLVVLSGEAPETFLARLGRMGVDAPATIASGTLVVVDWSTCWTQDVEGVAEVDGTIRASRKPDDLLAAVDRAVALLLQAPERRAFVDVLPLAAEDLDDAVLAEILKGVRSRLAAQAVTSIFVADRAAPERTLSALTKDFHAILDARGDGDEVLAFAVLRVGGAKLSPRYRRVRIREDGASVEAEPAARTFSCTICDARVPFDADRCPSCGTLRAEMAVRGEQPGLMNYLESLGGKRGVPPGPGRVIPRPTGEARGPGLTNGVRAGRVNGTALGRVNGVAPKGRTNGLARPSGMVNGTRGRTTGMTNGLTNGLARARSGITNGLTNGSGFTNGLGGRRSRAEARRSRWKLYLVPFLAASFLLSPLLLSESQTPPTFVVDGDFAEWSGVPGYVQDPAAGVNDTVALTGYKIEIADGDVHLFASVSGTWFGDTTSIDALYAFLDTDRNPATGYRVLGLGADAQAAVEGSGGTIFTVALRTWTGTGADPDNWTAWSPSGTFSAAAVGGNLELAFPWDPSWPTNPPDGIDPTVLLLADDGQTSRSYSIAFGPTLGALRATVTAAADVVSGGAAPLVSVSLAAFGGPVTVTDLTLVLAGGATEVPPNLPTTVSPGSPQILTISVNAATVASGTLASATVTSITTEGDLPVLITGGPVRAYVDTPPMGRTVDGWFNDWVADLTSDGDAARVSPDRDIDQYAANRTGTTLFLYTDVRGEILAGTPVPVHRQKPRPGGEPVPSSPSVPSRVAGEDLLRVYVDVDATEPDGSPVLGLRGADLLLEVRGIHGRVLSRSVYEWEGQWRRSTEAPVANDDHRLEANLSVPATGAVEVAFQTQGWDGPADATLVSGTRGARPNGNGYTYEGRFTATFAPSGRVEIAAEDAQFAWTLTDPYMDGNPPEVWNLETTPSGVRYSRDGAEVRLAVRPAGLDQAFMIERPVPSSRLSFPIEWGNRTLLYVEEGKPLAVRNAEDAVFELGHPDATFATGTRVALRFETDLDARVLGVSLPPALPLSVYPISVDAATSWVLRDDGPTYKPNENLGYSVAMGDFNGDGYADVLAGAPLWGYTGHTNVGYAYIYYGPINADDTTPDVRINGTTDNGRFGFAVAAGKFNSDNYWDALVSRYSQLSNAGPVCIFFGSGSWNGDVSTCDVKFEPQSDYNGFGIAVAAGNVDNAYYDDVLVGSPGHTNNNLGDGVVYLYKGPFASGADITSANYTLYPSSNSTGQLGKSVAVGKIDSDAYTDVVVGEPIYSSSAGRIQFYKGSNFVSDSGSRAPDATINAPSGGGSSSQFGAAVAIGPLDGDSYADVLVGSPTRNTNNGAAFIYLANNGGSGLSTGASPSYTLASQANSERLGIAVAIGDWESDGTGDAFVGAYLAPGQGGSPSSAGRMYWFDNPTSDQTVDDTIYGTAANERLGQSLAVGKFSSDSFVQLAIGAPNWPKTGTQTDGRVIVASIPEGPVSLVPLALAVPPVVWRLRASRDRRRKAPDPCGSVK